MVTKTRKFREYGRVGLPDHRQGFVLGDITNDEGFRGVDIMTDDYHIVTCDPESLLKLERDGELSELIQKPPKPNIQMTEPEINRLIWYRMSIRHDFWDRWISTHDSEDVLLSRAYHEEWAMYQSGTRAKAPVLEDIRTINVPVVQGSLLV